MGLAQGPRTIAREEDHMTRTYYGTVLPGVEGQGAEGIPAEEPAHAMEASKPANVIPIALWVIAILFGAAWMAVPLYLVG